MDEVADTNPDTNDQVAQSPIGAVGGQPIGVAPRGTSGAASSPSAPPSVSSQAGTPLRRDRGSSGTPRTADGESGTEGDSEQEPATGSDASDVDGTDAGSGDESAVNESSDSSTEPVAPVTYDDGWEVVFSEPPEPLEVVDDFSDTSDWFLFEQIIPFRPECYELGNAAASATEIDGRSVLAITANAKQTTSSNHALLGRYITSVPVALGPQQLTVQAQLDGKSLGQIQTGPEMSVQITAQMSDGSHRTAVFGLQYVASTGVWQVITGGEEKDAWTLVSTTPIQPDTWYEITLDFDTARNRYQRLRVTGPDNVLIDEPIDGLGTGWEDKGATEPATWVTLDAENLFTCDSPSTTTATVYYTDLSLVTAGG